MELIIITLLALITAETTYLTLSNLQPRRPKGTRGSRMVFVDTSVLMDGRIITVVQTGFLGGDTLVIPRSVIGELQLLADGSDHDKRERARGGLDAVQTLQAMPEVSIELFHDSNDARDGVDNRLLALAKQHGGAICTIDYNLQKVAVVEGIAVLNLNELAKGLRMAYLPGEKTMIELQQKGHDSHQAVGYLTDGTMVVVEQASSLIGKTVEVEFIRALQTAAGRMMFARIVGGAPKPAPKPAAVVAPRGRQPQVQKVKRVAEKPRTEKPAQQRPQQPQSQPKPQQQSKPPAPRRRNIRRDHEAAMVEMMNSGK